MNYQIRPAKRSEAKPLVGLYSESGCGKTLSALYLARGFVGDGKIVMLETESGRGEAYCDVLPGGYDVLPLRGNFAPAEYGKALTVIEESGPSALIIDSASHEWEGAGGVLSMAADNQAAGKKGPVVWQKPKMDHARHFILRLLATPIPLVIVCMRAKYPMRETKKADGTKEWVRSATLEPKQADDILFEMFIHGWIDREHRFHGTKYTRDDLKPIVKDGEPISIETGARLSTWAQGGATPAPPTPPKEARKQPPAKHTAASTVVETFEINGHEYRTAGCTKEQMLQSFDLQREVDEKHGKNTAAKLLFKEFAPAESRNDLTKEQAGRYLNRLRELVPIEDREPGVEG